MRLIIINCLIVLALLISCASGNGRSPEPVTPQSDTTTQTEITGTSSEPVSSGKHLQIGLKVNFNPETREFEVSPDRSLDTHLDLAYFWKYYPGMLTLLTLDLDKDAKLATLKIAFSNPLSDSLRDVRLIFPGASPVTPVEPDGYTVRGGADISNPDPWIGFGMENDLRTVEPHESVVREIVFKYKPPYKEIITPFILDATVNANTAEPYYFSEPELTGRLFHVAISDWQDDITGAMLDVTPCGLPSPLRLTEFGSERRWGTSIPDIPDGTYRLLLTAFSPETKGELGEDKPAVAVQWVDLTWPPDGPLVPLPDGNGIYCYSFIDPDTNLPPTNAQAFINKYRNDMGGDWMIVEYGEICNSGYLSMHSWVPIYLSWIHAVAPDLPIHLNLDNLGFPAASDDPCQHQPEGYTDLFFDHLITSIRGQILEEPDFDFISGLHFDIEIFPGQYNKDELFKIYKRYGNFLGRLHMEPDLMGRNITCYEFDSHPTGYTGDLSYLCTTDAFISECYFDRFSWDWDPSENITQFKNLEKIIGYYNFWSNQYGRPWYSIPATFSGWIDANQDTLEDFTLCPDWKLVLIDEYCFGKGLINTINEFDIVRAIDVHGLQVEKVVLTLNSGEPVFPSNGFAVYMLGDGDPSTPGDDLVFCRTAYSMARAGNIIEDRAGKLNYGNVVFRYENFQNWKASALADPPGRGDITCVSGQVRFGDGLSIQLHPELWGKITINLLDPVTPEILGNPAYRTSIDIVGVVDGSYIFPDLPRDVVTIQAEAEGWVSKPQTLDLTEVFAYRENIDLILNPI